MNPSRKNKTLTWVVILLLIANAFTIGFFWFGKSGTLPAPGKPDDFLIKELNLDSKQQTLLTELVKEHRVAAGQLREKIRNSKDAFFNLLKQPPISDSSKIAAAKAVSQNTEQLDLLTLDHFQKIRELCTVDQQNKFDNIIHEVTRMMAQPRPGGPGDKRPPPPK
jgi:protein CpxP